MDMSSLVQNQILNGADRYQDSVLDNLLQDVHDKLVIAHLIMIPLHILQQQMTMVILTGSKDSHTAFCTALGPRIIQCFIGSRELVRMLHITFLFFLPVTFYFHWSR